MVPALLGLARALQKSAACGRDAFRQIVETKGGVATAAMSQPCPMQEKCESGGQGLDLDAESITMLLTTVSGGRLTCLLLCISYTIVTVMTKDKTFSDYFLSLVCCSFLCTSYTYRIKVMDVMNPLYLKALDSLLEQVGNEQLLTMGYPYRFLGIVLQCSLFSLLRDIIVHSSSGKSSTKAPCA